MVLSPVPPWKRVLFLLRRSNALPCEFVKKEYRIEGEEDIGGTLKESAFIFSDIFSDKLSREGENHLKTMASPRGFDRYITGLALPFRGGPPG